MIIGQALAAEAAGAGDMVPFYADPETWLALAFLIFVALLARPIWRRVTSGLDSRAESIKAELEEARKLREEAQAMLASYQRKQRDAAKEAEAIVQQAEEDARLITEEAEKALQETLRRHEAMARERIAQAESHAIEEVRNEAVEIALAATRHLLEERVDAAKSEELVEAAIKELAGSLKG